MNERLMQLMDDSVRVSRNSTVVVHPLSGVEEVLNMCEISPKFNGCFATNNSTACFVHENQIFVTPITQEALSILHENDFRWEIFYVPFSNGDYPKINYLKWFTLMEKANDVRRREFNEECMKWCKTQGIDELAEVVMKRTFKIPVMGMEVSDIRSTKKFYPELNGSLDCTAIDKLGHYNTNNGIVVFVYCDGETYIARASREIMDALNLAGYKKSEMYVPMSNNETIDDRKLQSQWEDVKSA